MSKKTWNRWGWSISVKRGTRFSMGLSLLILTVCGLSFLYLRSQVRSLNKQKNQWEAKLNIETQKLTQEKFKLQALEEKNSIEEGRYQLSEAIKQMSRNYFDTAAQGQLTSILYRTARKYEIPPLLLVALIQVESGFNPKAQGRFRNGRRSGAYGLMQVKRQTARESLRFVHLEKVYQQDIFNPQTNIMAGTTYLMLQILRFGDLRLGITAYHRGPTEVRRNPERGKRLSKRYYQAVMNIYKKLNQTFRRKP